jgi:pimeloyl-ACP methyl ester carboxylesterase
MGTSVANELMARDLEGKLEMELAGVLLFNGSMVLERASPILGQRILRSRFGQLFARLSSERVFRQQFGSVFSAAHPLSEAEAADQCEEHAGRWHGAIREWPGDLRLAWGLLDRVATTEVLAAMRELRPAVPVTELPELAHYPQLEDPRQIARALRSALPPP